MNCSLICGSNFRSMICFLWACSWLSPPLLSFLCVMSRGRMTGLPIHPSLSISRVVCLGPRLHWNILFWFLESCGMNILNILSRPVLIHTAVPVAKPCLHHPLQPLDLKEAFAKTVFKVCNKVCSVWACSHCFVEHKAVWVCIPGIRWAHVLVSQTQEYALLLSDGSVITCGIC